MAVKEELLEFRSEEANGIVPGAGRERQRQRCAPWRESSFLHLLSVNSSIGSIGLLSNMSGDVATPEC